MKMDRTKLSVVDLKDSSDIEYWNKQSPKDRLLAIQIHRQVAYGRSTTSGRLQRILEINPDLAPGDQINPTDPRRWLVVKREKPVPDPATIVHICRQRLLKKTRKQKNTCSA